MKRLLILGLITSIITTSCASPRSFAQFKPNQSASTLTLWRVFLPIALKNYTPAQILPPQTTDQNGEATFSLPEGDVKVKAKDQDTNQPLSGINIQVASKEGEVLVIAVDPSGSYLPSFGEGSINRKSHLVGAQQEPITTIITIYLTVSIATAIISTLPLNLPYLANWFHPSEPPKVPDFQDEIQASIAAVTMRFMFLQKAARKLLAMDVNKAAKQAQEKYFCEWWNDVGLPYPIRLTIYNLPLLGEVGIIEDLGYVPPPCPPRSRRESPIDRDITLTAGESQTFVVKGEDLNCDLRGAEWYKDGVYQVSHFSMFGCLYTDSQSFTFNSPGNALVEAVVFDTDNLYSDPIEWYVTITGTILYHEDFYADYDIRHEYKDPEDNVTLSEGQRHYELARMLGPTTAEITLEEIWTVNPFDFESPRHESFQADIHTGEYLASTASDPIPLILPYWPYTTPPPTMTCLGRLFNFAGTEGGSWIYVNAFRDESDIGEGWVWITEPGELSLYYSATSGLRQGFQEFARLYHDGQPTDYTSEYTEMFIDSNYP